MPVPVPFWFRAAARVRGIAMPAGLLGIILGTLGGLVVPDRWLADPVVLGLAAGGFLLVLAGSGLTLLPVAPDLPARPVASPVVGRWAAVNSPASRVPSHGTHGCGQTYAIDLAYEPEPGARPAFGTGPTFRDPADFPGFGREVYAPADGRVVDVRDAARDHRSRSTWAGYAYLMVEGSLRELAGPRWLLGNYVVVDLGEGAYAVLAHLRRGSVAVRPGEAVRRGQLVGRCGNSGNSSEPHLHFQLMDRPRPLVAAGLPFTFAGSATGVPANGDALVANGRP